MNIIKYQVAIYIYIALYNAFGSPYNALATLQGQLVTIIVQLYWAPEPS